MNTSTLPQSVRLCGVPARSRLLASALLLTAGLATSSHAATTLLVNDTFTGGANANTTAYPRWQNDGNGTITYASPSDNLAITAPINGDNGRDNISLRQFAETTLGVGDVITLSYDFTSNISNTVTGVPIYRMGLYNLGTTATIADATMSSTYNTISKAGYYSFFRNGTNGGGDAGVIRRDVFTAGTTFNNNIMGGTGGTMTLLANTTTPGTIGIVTRSVVFSVTNLGGGVTSITSTIYSAAGGQGSAIYSLSGTDNSGLVTFDALGLLTPISTAPLTVTYDNIQVALTTAIPEPGSYALALGGVALTGVALRRRRNRA
jgi:hypothetical protein